MESSAAGDLNLRLAVFDLGGGKKNGDLKPHQVSGIQQFIKENYREMYARWQEYSDTGFHIGKPSV